MDSATHWESIYGKRPPQAQGWYAPELQPSLTWILKAGIGPDELILDAGGGASTLVDGLLNAGHRATHVLDLSPTALHQAKERLGKRAESVKWTAADLLSVEQTPGTVALWHDRAVFHFLHSDADRASYRKQVLHAVKPGGFLILGSFRPGAPPKCSGLPVRHHTARELTDFFGPEFTLEESIETVHVTPGGVGQAYVFVRMRRLV